MARKKQTAAVESTTAPVGEPETTQPRPMRNGTRRGRKSDALNVHVNQRTRHFLQALAVMGYGSSPAAVAGRLLRRSIAQLEAGLRQSPVNTADDSGEEQDATVATSTSDAIGAPPSNEP